MSVEAERLRRMRAAWQDDSPDAFELARAERRFFTRRGGWRFGIASWTVIGASAGFLAMLALSPITGSSEPARETITAEPIVTPAVTRPEAPAIETAPPVDEPSTKPARTKPPRPRSGSAKLPEPNQPPVAQPVRDEAALRAAPRWIAVGRGPDSEPVITGLEHEKGSAKPGN